MLRSAGLVNVSVLSRVLWLLEEGMFQFMIKYQTRLNQVRSVPLSLSAAFGT